MSEGLVADMAVSRGDSFHAAVSFDIPPGQTAALLGPNGAGKSSVMAALAGLLPLDRGHVRLSGVVFDDPASGRFLSPNRRNVGVVFQDYVLFPHMNVIENIAFGLVSRGVDRKTARRKAGSWLDRMELAGLAQVRPGDLSGGQAQRVALARALVTEPDLLLLDEPLAAVDVGVKSSLRRLIAEHMREFAGPRLLITHDPTDAFLLADQILVIEGGSLTQRGTAREMRLRPKTPYAASVAGVNLFAGRAGGGVVDTDSHRLHIADHEISGPVLATIRPTSVSVHLVKPEGSPRNSWPTSVEIVEHLGDVVRLMTGNPLPLTVEITEDASTALELVSGSPIWVSIKATEILVEPDR